MKSESNFRHYCKGCQRPFYGTRRARYCSDECKTKDETRICPMCGDTFTSYMTTKFYCSPNCQKKANKIKQRERRLAGEIGELMEFNPTRINSFFESEAERRQRLGRPKL